MRLILGACSLKLFFPLKIFKPTYLFQSCKLKAMSMHSACSWPVLAPSTFNVIVSSFFILPFFFGQARFTLHEP